MKVLGVCASGDAVHFAIVADDKLIDREPKRYVVPRAVIGGEQLQAMYRGIKGSVGNAGPDFLALFIPVYPPKFHPSYQQARERARLETLVELAAAESGIRTHLVSSRQARNQLQMETRGSIPDAAAKALGLKERPDYWAAGRGEAAAAAIAFVRDE